MALKIFKNKGENGAIPLSAENLNYNFNDLDNRSVNESGSNNNGSWIKFNNGLMITIHQVNQSLARTSEWGSMYETNQAANLGDYPQGFKYTPYIFLTLYGQNALFESINDATKTSAGKVFLIAPTSNVEQTYTIQVFAIGQWK